MPREMRYQYFWCEIQIDDGSLKYSASGSLLLRVFLAANPGRRVGLDDSIWGLVVDGMIVGDWLCKMISTIVMYQ